MGSLIDRLRRLEDTYRDRPCGSCSGRPRVVYLEDPNTPTRVSHCADCGSLTTMIAPLPPGYDDA